MKVPRWVQWGVSLLLLVLLVRTVDLAEAGSLLVRIDPVLLGLALLVGLLDRAVMILKWLPLARIQMPGLGLIPAGRVYLASGLAGTFLPASVGADVLRAVALGRTRGRIAELGVSIFVERLLGAAGSGLLVLVAVALAVALGTDVSFILPWAVGLLVLTAAVALVPFVPSLRRLARRTLEALPELPGSHLVERAASAWGAYAGHPGTLAWVFVASFLEQLHPVIQAVILSAALGTPVELTALLVSLPLAMFVSRLPIAVGDVGIGVFEGAMTFLLGLFGVEAAVALALALSLRLVILACLTPGALFWSDLRGVRPEAVEAGDADPAPARVGD